MKKVVCLAFLISAVMILMPLCSLDSQSAAKPVTMFEQSKFSAKVEKVESFRVLDSQSGKISEIKTEDYILGVVAAEMPALYHEEALKAQAVAAYTYACKKRANNRDKEYDITTDHTKDQSYCDSESMKEKWGSKTEEYTEKIKKAVRDTNGYVITYNDELITAVYHAISAGKTEDCKNVWGSDVAYLKSVSSEGDKLSANYMTEAKFTTEEIKEKFSDVEFDEDFENWFSASKKTSCGTVLEISLCNKLFSGDDVREILNLRSANFETEYKNNEFVFTVYGYGHGVGMSQNGADYMAKQGFDFKEILKHYYTDCKVEKIG